MINNLRISNKNVYLEGVQLLKVLKLIPNYETKDRIKVYTIHNVVFCSVSGILTVYLADDNTYKLVFTSFNAVNIYGISDLQIDFNNTIDILKEGLAKNYRTISDWKYFNKKYEFTLTHNSNNFSILITQRSI